MRINFQTINYNPNKYKQKSHQNPVHAKSINFQAIRCSTKNFEIKKLENLHCPVCGLIMLNENEQKTFIDDVSNKKGEALKKALEKYEDESVFVKDESKNRRRTIYRPQKQQIVDILKQLAVQNPDLNLAELVKLYAKPCLERLIEEQMKIIDELEEYIKNQTLPLDERLDFKNIIIEYKERIEGAAEIKFKRKEFIHDVQFSVTDPKIQKGIEEIAERMPTSDTEANAFFVKYSNPEYTPRDIANKLIQRTSPTTEHLVPKSKHGSNKTNNYICDCEECNSSRGDILFEDWMKDYPNFQEELQQYLERIQRALDTGELDPKYDSYIKEIISTLSNLSNGLIQLKTPVSTNSEKIKTGQEKRKIEIEKIGREMGVLSEKIKSLKAEIEALEKEPQFDNISQHSIVISQIGETSQKIAQTEKELAAAEKERTFATKALAEIAELEAKQEDRENFYPMQIKIRIREINRTLQLKKINESSEAIETLTKALENYKKQLSRLKEKEAVLKKIIKPEDDSVSLLNNLNIKFRQMQAILLQIENLEDSIFDKSLLEERLEDIFEENAALEAENQAILNRDTVNPDDRSKYEEYLHLVSLFETSKEIQEFLMCKTNAFEETAEEILEFAQSKIKEKIIELFERDDVRYFANIEKMEANAEETAIITTRLEEISESEPQLDRLEEELAVISEGQTSEEIKSFIDELEAQINLRNKIENIAALRIELQNLQETLSYNLGIFKQLKSKYRALTDEQYKNLVSLMYY